MNYNAFRKDNQLSMIKHKDHFHGSDLEQIESIYHIRKEEIVSFSANVNPLGVSPKLKEELASHIDIIATYPDREYTSLRKCIADYVGSVPENIIVGNGSTELISLFIQNRHPKKALILGPTYSEYEHEISLSGGTTLYYPLKEEDHFRLDTDKFISKLDENLDLVILCNPNNPTSSCISKQDMRQILDVCKEHDIYVMVDETYIEFVEHIEQASAVGLTSYYNNIIILRGTSKFFATPGLRLGYAICGNEDLVQAINQKKDPWTINSLAAYAGEVMFSDTEYIESTRALIASERARVYDIFNASERFLPYKPTANFMLVRILDSSINSHMLFDKAIRQKMMIRDCSTFPFLDDSYLRFCFMKPEDNDRLIDCLMGD